MGGMDAEGIPQHYLPPHWWALYGGTGYGSSPTKAGHVSKLSPIIHTHAHKHTMAAQILLTYWHKCKHIEAHGGEACAVLSSCPT